MSYRVRRLGWLMDSCLVVFLLAAPLAIFTAVQGSWFLSATNAVLAVVLARIYRNFADMIQLQLGIERDYERVLRLHPVAGHA